MSVRAPASVRGRTVVVGTGRNKDVFVCLVHRADLPLQAVKDEDPSNERECERLARDTRTVNNAEATCSGKLTEGVAER
jgi:hypothetical protein